MEEEKGPVLPDRPADPPTIAVIAPFGVFDNSAIAEPIIRVQFIVLVIPIASAVPIVAAPPRDHLNLGAQRTGEVHTSVVRLDSELLEAFNWSRDHGSRGGDEPGVVTTTSLHVAGGIAAKTTWPYASWRLSPRVAPQNQ